MAELNNLLAVSGVARVTNASIVMKLDPLT